MEDIQNGRISSKEADSIFEYLEELSINNLNLPEINELIFEGRILHDLGKSYGADLDLMKKLAKRLMDYSS